MRALTVITRHSIAKRTCSVKLDAYVGYIYLDLLLLGNDFMKHTYACIEWSRLVCESWPRDYAVHKINVGYPVTTNV